MNRKRILIVDDEPHVIRVLRLTLEREGYSVETASNGRDALAQISFRTPDLLITDVQMPHAGGRELCEVIRRQFQGQPFPIFVMSSMTAIEGRNWIQGFQHIEFLEKPLSPRLLVERLATLFASPQAGAELSYA